MIQIYAPNNSNFTMNGDDILTPTLCEVEAKLGGTWVLNMTHPIDDEGKWKNIVKEAVISVPTFMGKRQLFRIDDTDKQDTEITAKAYPIFFDSADEVFLMDTRPTGKNGQEALDILTQGTKYSGESDIAIVNTAYFVRRNLMDCINGDSPSFISTWGGEPLYDNYKVIINQFAGGDYGAEVRYGKNMDGISFKEDMSEVVTRIVPIAYNGRTLSTNYVDSPLIDNYVKIYVRELEFKDVIYYEDIDDNTDTEGMIICNSQAELDAALIEKCNSQFDAGIDIYKVVIDVDLIAIENTQEYEDFADIVKIGLGDIVRCYNSRLNISTRARAVQIKWDCITDSAKGVTLGDYEANFIEKWNSAIEKKIESQNDEIVFLKSAIVNTLTVNEADIRYAQIDQLDVIEANITNAVVGTIDGRYATFDLLEAAHARISTLETTALTASSAEIKTLQTGIADINTLIFGSAAGGVIQTEFSNSVIAQVGDAQIKSAMIENLSASKVTAGDIITNNVRVMSQDGSLIISDETMQISDGSRVRVQIGKDASNDYSINIWDAAGNLMFSEGGITDSAIKDSIIRDDMVSENANINAKKLDIDSLFTEINGSSNTIKSTKVYFDSEKQTLDAAFKTMTTTVDGILTTQSSQETSISAIQGQISSKIWQQDITAAVDGINIGGRNLFRDTKTMSSTNGFVSRSSATTLTKDENDYYIAELPADGAWHNVTFFFQDSIENMEGKEVTISFDAKSDGLVNSGSRWQFAASVFNASGTRRAGINAGYFSGSLCNTGDYVNGEWVRVRATIVLPSVAEMAIYSASVTAVKYGIQIFSSTSNVAYPLQIKKVKCEYGNKATDWTPAPEDTEGEITALSTQYSSLEQNLEGFKTTVSMTYTKLDSFNALEIGGTNLLPDTNVNTLSAVAGKATRYWSDSSVTYVTNEFIELADPPVKGLKYGIRQICSSTGSTNGGRNLTWRATEEIEMEDGADYTLSCYARITSGTQARLRFRFYNGGNQTVFKVIDNTEWKRISVTITANKETWGADYCNIGCGGLTGAYVATVELCGFKLEKGNKATDWTPAPGDVAVEISAVSTVATQTAEKFNWIVKSGTSASDFTITDRMATLTAQYINLNGLVEFSALNSSTQSLINTANTNASNALNSHNGLGMKVNYSTFTNANNGELYLCKREPSTNALSDANGWIWWNGVKRTVAKTMVNPNSICPYNTTIYLVLRLNSLTSTTGTTYMVWYNSSNAVWQYAVTPTPTEVAGTWTWDTTGLDVVIGSFVEPSSEGAIINAQIFNPSKSYQEVTIGKSAYEVLGEWCYNNNKTYINGGKIYAKSIKAQSIDVEDLFAQSITATGSITGMTIISNGSTASDTAVIDGGWIRVGSETGSYVGIANGGINWYYNGAQAGGIRNNMAGGIEIAVASKKPFGICFGSEYVLTVNKNASYMGFMEITYPLMANDIYAVDIDAWNIVCADVKIRNGISLTELRKIVQYTGSVTTTSTTAANGLVTVSLSAKTIFGFSSVPSNFSAIAATSRSWQMGIDLSHTMGTDTITLHLRNLTGATLNAGTYWYTIVGMCV